MDVFILADKVEVTPSTAGMLIGKTIKTVQRWCADGRLASRVVDMRGKRLIRLSSLLPFADVCFEDIRLIEQADSGHAEAQNEIGIIFLEAGKKHIAFEWFQKAAAAHHPDAMHWLGNFYIRGNMGVEKNESLGIKWLAGAAAQGHIIAQAQIYAIYENSQARPLSS